MRNVLKWFLFSLAFVPLFWSTDVLFPFIFTKVLFLRAVISASWIIFTLFIFTRRKEVISLIRDKVPFVKNPVFIFTVSYIFLTVLSTLFAVNRFKAFFGDIERGEGLLGILYFFSFFILSLIVFEKKDWVSFFKFNIITGIILFFDALSEILSGELMRAQSSTGNPTFLAAYFLFVVFSAVVVLTSDVTRPWKYIGFLMALLGSVGVFLTGTRGAILGLFAGAFLSVVYFAVKKSDSILLFKKLRVNLQKISITILVLGILGLGAFIVTRNDAFWQDIPGIRRFTELSLDDPTLQTRLISAGVSLDAVNPTKNSIDRVLFGYGPDNFNIAYNKYFNPEYLRYENLWFDRAHNKIFDVLVMNGVFGLLAYIGLWFSLIYIAFRKIKEKNIAATILFFSAAYFVQNIFVFDQVVTYIPFFGLLAFFVFSSTNRQENTKKENKIFNRFEKFIPYKVAAIALFFSISFVLYSIIPYFQSFEFISILKEPGSAENALNKIKSFSSPYNFGQGEIRHRLLRSVMAGADNPEMVPVLNESLRIFEEYVQKQSYDPRDWDLLGNIYAAKGNLGEPGAYEKAKKYYLQAHELSPTRPDHLYNIGILYANQGNFEKMQQYAGEMFELGPDVPRIMILYSTIISREGQNRYAEAVGILNRAVSDPNIYFGSDVEENVIRDTYGLYIDYFFNIRDEENFVNALTGARDFELRIEERSEHLFAVGAIDVIPPKKSTSFDITLQQFFEGGFDTLVNRK